MKRMTKNSRFVQRTKILHCGCFPTEHTLRVLIAASRAKHRRPAARNLGFTLILNKSVSFAGRAALQDSFGSAWLEGPVACVGESRAYGAGRTSVSSGNTLLLLV